MSDIIDGQDAIFEVGGVIVGGIYQYQFFNGSPTVTRHASLTAPAREYVPTQPDYGTATLQLYRDHGDPGQQRLAASQAGRITEDCTLSLSDGRVLGFRAHCESIPLIGGKRNGQSINTSPCRIRITGPVSLIE